MSTVTRTHARSTPAEAGPLRPRTTAPRRRHGVHAAWYIAAVTAIWSTTLFVVALWVAGGGVTDLFGEGADIANSLGRLLGLGASNLLLLQVLLMARVPLFEKGIGRDTITRLHRLTGFWSFWMMLAHIALLTVGYAGTLQIGAVIAQLWDFVWNYPAMLLATVGTLLIIGVVALSIRRARRAVRYESWHLLHLYAYIGVGLALPHQLWTGTDFLSNPVATAYWWGLWAVSAGCVVVFRVLVPLLRSARAGLVVDSVSRDGNSGVTMRMTGRNVGSLKAESGQFFVFRFLDGRGWMRAHPFSLSAAPDGRSLQVTARIVGDGTQRMTHLRRGTKVIVEGPYGHMVGTRRRGRKLLMIGAGAGIAPLVSLLEDQDYAPGEAILLARDSDPKAALRVARIQQLVAERGLRYEPLTGRRTRKSAPWLPETHEAWKGTQMISYLAPDLENWDIFICGPVPWMKVVRADLDELGVRADHIHSEAFAI